MIIKTIVAILYYMPWQHKTEIIYNKNRKRFSREPMTFHVVGDLFNYFCSQ